MLQCNIKHAYIEAFMNEFRRYKINYTFLKYCLEVVCIGIMCTYVQIIVQLKTFLTLWTTVLIHDNNLIRKELFSLLIYLKET